MRRVLPVYCSALAALLWLVGCDLVKPEETTSASGRTQMYTPASGAQFANASGMAGVTVGGAQDIGAARAIIEAGGVPAADLITYEGLFSEHDIPTTGQECGNLLCVEPAVAVYRPIMGDTDRVLIQLAMSSNVDAASFHHAPSQLVLVVDRSGSMAGSADTANMSKVDAVKAALEQVVGVLPEHDEVALISFNHEHTVDLPLGPLTSAHRSIARAAISTWQASGSTDIESPLRHAFEILAAAPNPSSLARRVLLFTDALPNTGNYADEDFLTLTAKYSEQDIGLTAFGVGFDFGAELAKQISEVRGGNYVFMRNGAEIERMLSEDLEFLLTPIAYDFSLTVKPAAGFSVSTVYGMPGGDPNEFSMSAATLFLSSRTGALAVELTGPAETIIELGPLAEINLGYEPTTTRSRVAMTVSPMGGMLANGVDGVRASFAGVQKLVALVNMATGMRDAINSSQAADLGRADAILTALETHIAAVGTALGDQPLLNEALLIARLRQNIHTGAEKATVAAR